MAEPIISVSGLRGIIGETLTPDVAVRYVAAFAATCPTGTMLVGRDSRPSGEMLAQAVHAGLRAAGHTTIDLGICPTPTIGVMVRKYQATGGVQITASHNPPPYNGLKLFSNAGRIIPNEPGAKVLQQYRSGKASWAKHDRIGATQIRDDVYSAHLEAVLATVDVEAIRKKAFPVLLDSNHGAGGPLGRMLLEALGCKITILGETPDGQFEHKAEPTAENLAEVLSAVPQSGARIGFCQDPDADRLAVIDAAGRYLGEEYTVAIIANHILANRRGSLVTNCSTSRMTEDIAGRYGQRFFRSAVGEANVVDVMLAKDALFGGEGNGGPIDPRVGLVRDSFVGMAQLLDAMAARDASIRELADELPSYAIVKTKIDLPADRVAAGLDALERHFEGARADRLDGLRLDWPEAWLLVRPSNTEPIVRAIAEAPDQAEAERLCDEAEKVLGQV
jgi:phosphomannomutase